MHIYIYIHMVIWMGTLFWSVLMVLMTSILEIVMYLAHLKQQKSHDFSQWASSQRDLDVLRLHVVGGAQWNDDLTLYVYVSLEKNNVYNDLRSKSYIMKWWSSRYATRSTRSSKKEGMRSPFTRPFLWVICVDPSIEIVLLWSWSIGPQHWLPWSTRLIRNKFKDPFSLASQKAWEHDVEWCFCTATLQHVGWHPNKLRLWGCWWRW